MLKKRYKNEYGKRGICVPAFTALAMLAMSGTALAAGWSMESGNWHYINYDGSYATDCFKRPETIISIWIHQETCFTAP